MQSRQPRWVRVTVIVVVVLVALALALSIVPADAGGVVRPPANATADYQLGGAYRPAADVCVVTRDRTANPAGR